MQGVSVIIPVHNAGSYLQTTIDSILNQTHTKLQCLIIDDHSNDEAINQLAINDNRLSIIKNNGRGIVAALNTGIQHAHYDYIARMDADDIAHPERLEIQLALLNQHPEVDICGCQVEMFSDDFDIADGYRHYESWINSLTSATDIADSMFIESPMPHPSILMHKKVLEILGHYHDTPWPEDYDLWLRAHIHDMKFAKPEKVLLKWRDHPQRLSRHDQRYSKRQFINCKAYYFAKRYPNKTCLIWGTGPTGLMLHDALTEQGIEISAFIDISKKMIGRKKRNKLVLDAYQLKPSNELVLTAVSARGAREEINQYLEQQHFINGEHYINLA